MKVLVTGGAGFIGSHIVEKLLITGYRVSVLDNFSSGSIRNLKKARSSIKLIRGDIRSSKTCLHSTRGVDCLLHQAALRSVPKSMLNPREYNQVNIQGTLNLLEAARINRVKSFVFASSSSVYGEVKTFPEKESFKPGPISPYALTKLSGEHYCRMFSIHYGLPTVSLRYFNVFGPRQSLDDEYSVVIPKFITCMLANKRPPIYGSGKQSRDFTYVANVVEANLLAMRRTNATGEVFNVAGGKDYTILKLADILNSLIGKDLAPKFLPKRSGDVFRTRADLASIRKKLKFRPKTDFITGLKLTVESFRGRK
ncbi:MAG: NAD-dependent epimerase/dehydratase family protein [Candidatus Omnitrophica bacterium]|nr:NAD-dependent epimerase/dehydratase family protein [Candidatus Omnitrophota bacterium]